MSNVEAHPVEVDCGAETTRSEAPVVQVIEHREVPLGGQRAMRVNRTLPARGRSMVGAWCFVDHYGPSAVADTGGMVVPPHPHTGLQTVSWLFDGRIEHRDSLGTVGDVVPGEVNLMTAGRGISHSEVSTPDTTTLHGVQLWVALTDADRHTDPAFENWRPEAVALDQAGSSALVFVGSMRFAELAESEQPAPSPVAMFTPIVGAEVRLAPDAQVVIAAEQGYEYGVLADTGEIEVDGVEVPGGSLAYLAPGAQQVSIRAGAGGGRVVVLGGTPFGERIVMWWNFIGRTHEEVVAFRDRWQTEIGDPQVEPEQFGSFSYDGDPLPAPALPQVRLRPRG